MRVSMLALALILFSPAVFSWAQTVNGPEGEKNDAPEAFFISVE